MKTILTTRRAMERTQILLVDVSFTVIATFQKVLFVE